MIKEYIEKVFWIQDQIKLLHWQTLPSGFQHTTLGDFYNEISNSLDNLIETSIAVFGEEINTISDSLFKLENHYDSIELTEKIYAILLEFRTEFETTQNFALINIIDDLCSLTLKYKYLLRLK